MKVEGDEDDFLFSGAMGRGAIWGDWIGRSTADPAVGEGGGAIG